ncbi:MAG: DsbA family protein [Bermanella sp.]
MIQVDYFSDVLCIWAFIGEKRLNEVRLNLAEDVQVNLQFLPNFASCHKKIQQGWKNKGGFDGYANHVNEVAHQFEASLHPDSWHKVQPSTSMLAHAIIKTIMKLESIELANQYSALVRHSFFMEAMDISRLEVLQEIAESLKINWIEVMDYFNGGFSLADLQQDFQNAQSYQVSVSPAWVFNEGRQRLIGNVGYRVIEANLKELVEQKPMPQLWC